MLRFKLSKFKQVCSSILLPRILFKNLKYSKGLNYNRALEQFSKVSKSTNSSDKNKASEKQTRIIEQCFGEKSPGPKPCQRISKVKEVKDDIVFTPEFYNLKQCDRCETVISKLFKNESINEAPIDKTEPNISGDAKIQATTAKQDDEKLTQKIEIVDETPHVEAHAPKVEGFNSVPKILGGKVTYEMSKTQSCDEQANLDELAKRCLGSPVSDIDKIVTQELKRVSRNNSQPNLDVDLVRNQGVNSLHEVDRKFFCRYEKIQPLHLDTLPLRFTVDVASDYKESAFIREYSRIFFTADADDTRKDIPPPLSPYENPAHPFYEYPNKENITPEDDSKLETATIDENIHENEIIIKDESLQRNAFDQEDGGQIVEGEENLNPKPHINQCHDSILQPQIVTLAEEKAALKNNFIQDNIPTLNIFNSQQLFTSKAETPDVRSDSKDEPHNSSISSTYLPEGDRRTIDLPENTSISANQNPDEYYNISLLDEFVTDDRTVKRIFAESPVTQNIFYSALPQIELNEATERAETISENVFKDSQVVFEPEAKKKDLLTKEPSVEANLDELATRKGDKSCSEGTVPLSLLLKHIRERNRLEYCRKIVAKADIKLEGNKKFSGQQADKTKSKNDCAKPCQPQPKPDPPACEPCKISPCPPKKDPCAKFLPIFLSTMIRRGVSFDIVKHKDNTCENTPLPLTSLSLISVVMLQQIQRLGDKLKFHANNNCGDAVNYARDFQPWIPIPSWPIPKKEKKRPFVCPKEGCKIPLPQPNKPCKDKQCFGLSKQSFASGLIA